MTENVIGDPRCDICGEIATHYIEVSEMLLCIECEFRIKDRCVHKIMSLTDDEILAMPSDKSLDDA